MHTLTRLGACAATLTVAIIPAATFETAHAAADSSIRVPLKSDLRLCDFSLVATANAVSRPLLGFGSALISTSGSRATAEVNLVDASSPGTHFDVGLIEEPRPSSATCGPGDPGTAFTGMDTDAAGSGTVTVENTMRQGTTGLWVIVERGDPHSHTPAEFYTSEILAPV
jgi:hypothetical protein